MKILHSKSGYTLIEVILTMTILGIILVPLSSLFSTSLGMNIKARERFLSNNIARGYMEQILTLNKPISDVSDSLGLPPNNENIYKFKDKSGRFDITVRVAESEEYKAHELSAIKGDLQLSLRDDDYSVNDNDKTTLPYTENKIRVDVPEEADGNILFNFDSPNSYSVKKREGQYKIFIESAILAVSKVYVTVEVNNQIDSSDEDKRSLSVHSISGDGTQNPIILSLGKPIDVIQGNFAPQESGELINLMNEITIVVEKDGVLLTELKSLKRIEED